MSESTGDEESRSGSPLRPAAASDDEEDVLVRAIARITKRIATAAEDDEVDGFVEERKAMRAELRELRERHAGNVVAIRKEGR